MVVEGHALEGAHDHGHVGAVVLVGPAAGAAEGVDDGHAKAIVEDAVDLLEPALAEQAAAGGKLAAANAAAGIAAWASADFIADAARTVVDGDVERSDKPGWGRRDVEAAGADELFEAAGEAAGGVLEGEVEDARLADGAAEHLAAGVDGDGDLGGEDGFASLGRPAMLERPTGSRP